MLFRSHAVSMFSIEKHLRKAEKETSYIIENNNSFAKDDKDELLFHLYSAGTAKCSDTKCEFSRQYYAWSVQRDSTGRGGSG